MYADANLTEPLKGQSSSYDHHVNKLGKHRVSDAIYQDPDYGTLIASTEYGCTFTDTVRLFR